MRYLALTITINNEVPDHRTGLMKEIVDHFVGKGYYFSVIGDKSTKPDGVYIFRTDILGLTSIEEFDEFLRDYEDKGVKYELVPINDTLEFMQRKNNYSVEL